MTKKKRCPRCTKSFPPTLKFFYKNKSMSDGLSTYCRDCHGKYQKEWQNANKPRFHALVAAAKLRSRGCEISTEQFLALREDPEAVCSICKKQETVIHYGKVAKLAIDHDHKTGKIRGLLCRRCNTGIANFEDDVTRLQAAIDYLSDS